MAENPKEISQPVNEQPEESTAIQPDVQPEGQQDQSSGELDPTSEVERGLGEESKPPKTDHEPLRLGQESNSTAYHYPYLEHVQRLMIEQPHLELLRSYMIDEDRNETFWPRKNRPPRESRSVVVMDVLPTSQSSLLQIDCSNIEEVYKHKRLLQGFGDPSKTHHRVIVAEDLAPAIIDVLGYLLKIDPNFFYNHLYDGRVKIKDNGDDVGAFQLGGTMPVPNSLRLFLPQFLKVDVPYLPWYQSEYRRNHKFTEFLKTSHDSTKYLRYDIQQIGSCEDNTVRMCYLCNISAINVKLDGGNPVSKYTFFLSLSTTENRPAVILLHPSGPWTKEEKNLWAEQNLRRLGSLSRWEDIPDGLQDTVGQPFYRATISEIKAMKSHFNLDPQGPITKHERAFHIRANGEERESKGIDNDWPLARQLLWNIIEDFDFKAFTLEEFAKRIQLALFTKAAEDFSTSVGECLTIARFFLDPADQQNFRIDLDMQKQFLENVIQQFKVVFRTQETDERGFICDTSFDISRLQRRINYIYHLLKENRASLNSILARFDAKSRLFQMNLASQQLEESRMQLQESRKAIEQAETVRRLTILAFVFIPLSAVCSAFGMNVKELQGDSSMPSVWWFVLVSILAVGLTLLLAGLETIGDLLMPALVRWHDYTEALKQSLEETPATEDHAQVALTERPRALRVILYGASVLFWNLTVLVWKLPWFAFLYLRETRKKGQELKREETRTQLIWPRKSSRKSGLIERFMERLAFARSMRADR